MRTACRVVLALSALATAACASAREVASATSHTAPQVVFVTLGTGGGPVIRTDRGQPANAVVVGNDIYLFDMGAGAQVKLAQAGLDQRSVRAVFLSHHHIDHVAGLGPWLVTRWVLGSHHSVPVYGPRGTESMVHNLFEAALPVALAPVTIGGPVKPELATSVTAHNLAPEMDEPTEIYRDHNIRVLAVTNDHYHFPPDSAQARYSRSYAFRIETSGKTYVYTGDTGPSENVVELAEGADVLVSEVIDLEAIAATLEQIETYSAEVLEALLAHMEEDHLTPEQVGDLARRARVKLVVLTHLVPGNDGETNLDGYRAGISEEFAGTVVIASDLDRF